VTMDEVTNVLLNVGARRMNNMAQRACEMDKTDKHHAEEIDDRMHQLRNTSSRLGSYPGVEEFDNTLVVPTLFLTLVSFIKRCYQKSSSTSRFGRLMVIGLMTSCGKSGQRVSLIFNKNRTTMLIKPDFVRFTRHKCINSMRIEMTDFSPVLPSGELDETCASYLILASSLHYVKT